MNELHVIWFHLELSTLLEFGYVFIFILSPSTRIKLGQKASKLSKKLSNHIHVIEGCEGLGHYKAK